MRRFIAIAATLAATGLVGSLTSSSAQALTLPGPSAVSASATQQVYLSCTRYWNGWRWVRRCVDDGAGYYAPGYSYAPGYGYGYGYYGWRPRPRYYGYY